MAVGESAVITVHGRVKSASQVSACAADSKITNNVEVYHEALELRPNDNTAEAETLLLCDDVSLTKVVAERGNPSDDFTVSLLDGDGTPLVSASTGGAGQASTAAVLLGSGETYYLTEEPESNSPADLSDYEATVQCDTGVEGLDLVPVPDPDADGHRWSVTVPDLKDFPAAVSTSCAITNTPGFCFEVQRPEDLCPACLVGCEEGVSQT